jgi:plasmid stabilization system protein ParE
VLYRLEADRIVILRVIHAARDIGGMVDADA